MIYWLWFLANGLISLCFVIGMWPSKLYGQNETYANVGVLFGFLPGWFFFTFTTLASLVLMYVRGRTNRVALYVILLVASNVSALNLQHTVTGPIGCLLYSVVAVAFFSVSRTLFYKSEYYDPSSR